MASSNNKSIVFICGAVNAGKSTVGKLLAERLRAVFVEGDDIRKIFYWKTVEDARPEIIECIGALVKTLAQRGRSVVVAYPIWKEDHGPLMQILRGLDASIHFIALNPPLSAAVKNRGTRELADWEVQFIKELYAKGVNKPPFAKAINNMKIPPQKTVEKILKLLT